MLRLKLIHVSRRGPWCFILNFKFLIYCYFVGLHPESSPKATIPENLFFNEMFSVVESLHVTHIAVPYGELNTDLYVELMQWSNVFKQDLSSRQYFGEVCFIVTEPSCLWMDGILPGLFIVHAVLQRWLRYPDSKACKHVRNLFPFSASTSKYAESWQPIVTDFTFLMRRIK